MRKKKKQRNNYTYTLYIPRPIVEGARHKAEEIEMVNEIITPLISVWQKEIRKKWAHITTKPFIIVLNGGNTIKGTDKIKIMFELTQLNLSDTDISEFEKVVDNIVNEIKYW